MENGHEYEDLDAEREKEEEGGEEEEEEYDDDDDRSRKVSFSSRTRRAVLKPEPEIKTLPGTSLYCIAPNEERRQPPGADDDPYSSFVDLPEEAGFQPYVPEAPSPSLREPPPLYNTGSAPQLGALAAEQRRQRRSRAGNLTPLYLPETAHVDTSPRAFLQLMTGSTGEGGSGEIFHVPTKEEAEMTLKKVQNAVKKSFIAARCAL